MQYWQPIVNRCYAGFSLGLFCFDDWHDNYQGAPNDGSSWKNQTNENDNQMLVLHGGSWISDPEGCRSASRLSSSVAYYYCGETWEDVKAKFLDLGIGR